MYIYMYVCIQNMYNEIYIYVSLNQFLYIPCCLPRIVSRIFQQYLKSQNKEIKIVLGDPVGSIFAGFFKNGCIGESKPFLVEGVGKGSIPGAMDFGVVDSIVQVADQEVRPIYVYIYMYMVGAFAWNQL
jgi:hypothetical protein